MACGALFSAPGVLDDFAFWQRAVGEMNPTWANLLMGGGAVLICLSLLILIERHLDFMLTYAKELAILALMALILALIGGAIYYFVFVHEPTETVWTHQTLSVAEQERAKAECEMKAIEVGGSGFKIGSPRFEYETACLKSKGFALEKVK